MKVWLISIYVCDDPYQMRNLSMQILMSVNWMVTHVVKMALIVTTLLVHSGAMVSLLQYCGCVFDDPLPTTLLLQIVTSHARRHVTEQVLSNVLSVHLVILATSTEYVKVCKTPPPQPVHRQMNILRPSSSGSLYRH